VSPSTVGLVVSTTELGTLGFDLVDERGHLSTVPHTIDVFPFVSPRVETMSGERVTAVLLTVTPPSTVKEPLRFRCRWLTPPPATSYDEEDQLFVSWVWEGEDRLVQLRVRGWGQGSRHRCGCSKAATTRRPLMVGDGIGLAEVLLGLPGFRVLDAVETDAEVVVTVETIVDFTGCGRCGVRAESQDRMPVHLRDLPCFGRQARLVWIKRRWRCPDSDCDARTWTEACEDIDAQVVLTRRAGVEACRQVGEHARPVAQVAREVGVCWWTIMNAVEEHGTPLVDDPDRVGRVRQLGIDETSFLAATPTRATVYATGLVDLERHIVIDMVEGNSAADLRRWTANAHPDWLAGIEVVATDLAESFRAGLNPGLAHARRVADPFHVVRVRHEAPCIRGRVRDPPLWAVAAAR
jgi:Transposase/zinc-finger of transposase IS204/IS1001/IS1096/IS1165